MPVSHPPSPQPPVRSPAPRAIPLAPTAALLLLLAAAPARALDLDDDGHFQLRARVYSQAALRLEDSQIGTVPDTQAGQLVQHRNFFNPELGADLTPYTSWLDGPLRALRPDDLRFRAAGWAFYDGIYDYGTSQFERTLEQRAFAPALPPPAGPGRALYLEGSHLNQVDGRIEGADLDTVFPDAEILDPRDIYEARARINELYLSYTRGPAFLRVGRQFISWGEADTIALLDQNNPFDVTLAAPGIFMDLEEARIPLWTVRGSLRVFDVLGPLTGGTLEAYWVPGDLDTNTGFTPILTASPYSPRGNDPQLNLPCSVGLCNQLQFVFFDHVPERRFGNSRWGVRLRAVLDHEYTLSVWYYTHFPNSPVPRRAGPSEQAIPIPGKNAAFPLLVTEIVHELTSVTGVAASFFSEPLDSIVRLEVEYFDNEPAFIPERNFGRLNDFAASGEVPHADFLRGEIGVDHFFFLRPLNPSNSFLLIGSVVWSWNLSETGAKDFRAQGQLKPSFFTKPQGSAPVADDFVQLDPIEGFLQTTLQSEYLHGRLTPRLITIAHTRGTYLIQPQVEWRYSDWMRFQLAAVHIGGDYQGFGFFRDRDQISVRTTWQLN